MTFPYLFDIRYKGEIFENSEDELRRFSEFELKRKDKKISVVTPPSKGRVLLNYISDPNTKAVVIPAVTIDREDYCTVILTRDNMPILAIEMRFL